MKYIVRDGMKDAEFREYRSKVISGQAEPNGESFEEATLNFLELLRSSNESKTEE